MSDNRAGLEGEKMELRRMLEKDGKERARKGNEPVSWTRAWDPLYTRLSVTNSLA